MSLPPPLRVVVLHHLVLGGSRRGPTWQLRKHQPQHRNMSYRETFTVARGGGRGGKMRGVRKGDLQILTPCRYGFTS